MKKEYKKLFDRKFKHFMIICSPQLGLSPKSILGGEVFDREILLGLAKKGIKIEIILPAGKQHDKNIKNWNITYLPISHFPALLGNLLYLPYLLLLYKRTKFEILRIHQPQYLGLGALVFKLLHRNVKLIATYHQFPETKFVFLSKYINNFWDHIICDSENVKNKIINTYNIGVSKITVVHNGVPSYLKPQKKDQRLVKELGVKNKTVLLFMGLFIERKNPLFLIDVVKTLVDKNENVLLIFWGEGPLKQEMIRTIEKCKLKKQILFQKPIFGKRKNKIHNLADIFVHPAQDEGFALAPLEAMACAKPIIATRGWSAAEMITDGVNGYLASSQKEWVSAIKQLKNETKRHQIGKNSFQKFRKEFQWKYALNKHFVILSNLN